MLLKHFLAWAASWLGGEKNEHMVLGAMAWPGHLGQWGSKSVSLRSDGREQRGSCRKNSGLALAVVMPLVLAAFSGTHPLPPPPTLPS